MVDVVESGITGAELMTIVIFIVTVFGGVFAVWRYVENKISRVEEIADRTDRELAEYKTYVAENYITRETVRESMEPLMDAIKGMRVSLDHITTRVDRMFEGQSTRRTRTTKDE